jgi:hypothetical protein
MRQQSNSRLYNCIGCFFFLLSLGTIALTAAWLTETVAVPDPLVPATDIPIPTLEARVFWTPSRTLAASFTPFPTDTATLIPTRTASATQTPSDTPTEPPTLTPSNTATVTPSSTLTSSPTFTETYTPSASPTITLTPSPTGATNTPTQTQTAFPFVASELRIRANPQNNCSYQGIAGNVFDTFNAPLTGITVVVRGADLRQEGLTAVSGSNLAFAQSGWEIIVSSFTSRSSYTIQLQSEEGIALSAPIEVTFPGSCDSNQLLIQFTQTRPY